MGHLAFKSSQALPPTGKAGKMTTRRWVVKLKEFTDIHLLPYFSFFVTGLFNFPFKALSSTLPSRPCHPQQAAPHPWHLPLHPPSNRCPHTHTHGICKPGEEGWDSGRLARWVAVPATYTMWTPEYLHAAVRHGHRVVSQCVTGYLAVIGTGGWCKDVARSYMVRIDRLAPLEGPAGTERQQCIAGSRQEPGSPAGPGQPSAQSYNLPKADLLPGAGGASGQKTGATKGACGATASPWGRRRLRSSAPKGRSSRDRGPQRQSRGSCEVLSTHFHI